MKIVKQNLKAVLCALLGALTLFAAVSCQNKEKSVKATVEVVNETTVVISVEECSGGATLLDAMESLKKAEELDFSLSAGMVTEIGGKENGANSYWMLYTSDADFSNTAWGTVDYEGQTLGSAILGAEALKVSAGKIYLWSYQSF